MISCLMYLDPAIIAVQGYGEVGGVGGESEGGVEQAVRGGGKELDGERVIPLRVWRQHKWSHKRLNLQKEEI